MKPADRILTVVTKELVDTFRDRRNAYYFATNPLGALVDGLIIENGQLNREWDAIWDVRVRRSESGWTAEFAIPFKSLGFHAGVEAWGFNIQRTINLPVFALELLRPPDQPRVRFSKGKLDSAMGANVYIVEYREQTSPALIHGPQGRELFCHGRFWVDAPTGRVMKSELVVDDPAVHASVTTRYRVDQAYGLAVPVEMKEEYALPNGARVTGLATYGNFRRFDVQVGEELVK